MSLFYLMLMNINSYNDLFSNVLVKIWHILALKTFFKETDKDANVILVGSFWMTIKFCNKMSLLF